MLNVNVELSAKFDEWSEKYGWELCIDIPKEAFFEMDDVEKYEEILGALFFTIEAKAKAAGIIEDI